MIQNRMINEALVLLFSGIEREKEFYTKASRLEGQEFIRQHCTKLCGACCYRSSKDRQRGRKKAGTCG